MAGNWLIYEKGNDVKSVKVGMSWWGLIFGYFWMIGKGLKAGFILVGIDIAMLVGLVSMPHTGKHGDRDAVEAWFILSSFLAIFVSHPLAFLRGWHMYRKKIEKSGYALKPEKAVVVTGASHTDSLKELAQLHKDGIVTDSEFEAKRKEILDRM